MTKLVKIYNQIPQDVRNEILNKGFEVIGNMIMNKDKKVQGFIQSTSPTTENNNLADNIDTILLGMSARSNPIAFGIVVAGNLINVGKQIENIKNKLEVIGEKLDKIDAKVDIGYYAKFKAAIELADHAFEMSDENNRKSLTYKAIQSFSETKNTYAQYIEQELENDGRVISEYINILILSYIGQIHCYLELEEVASAKKVIDKGATLIKKMMNKYITTLLSNNPMIYLHNDFKDLEIDLEKLAKVYSWLDKKKSVNQIFNEQRDNFIEIHKNQAKAFKELPLMIWNPIIDVEVKTNNSYLSAINPLGYFQSEDVTPFLQERLKESFETIEVVTESYNRFLSIKHEVEFMLEKGISYAEWKETINANLSNGLFYIEVN